MWGDPKRLTVLVSAVLYDTLIEHRLWEVDFNQPVFEDQLTEITATILAGILASAIQRSRIEFDADDGSDAAPSSTYTQKFTSDCVKLTKYIDNGLHSELVSGYNQLCDANAANPTQLLALSTIFSTICWLLGNERKMLAGIRGGKPAWREFKSGILQNISTELDEEGSQQLQYEITQAIDIGMFGFREMISTAEAHLLPEWDAFQPNLSLSRMSWPEVDTNEVVSILEEAYYHQRYIVDPSGAYVRIVGEINGIIGLELKITAGQNDPNYFDFFARIDFADDRSHLVILDSLTASRRGRQLVWESTPFLRYLFRLIASVYHDLVTASDLPVAMSLEEAAGILHGASKPGWVAIPSPFNRARRKQARHPILEPIISEPHRVRGHPRKAKMSEEHRQALIDFEREYGVKIIEPVEELNQLTGQEHTFVRPHFSPKITSEDFKRLPQFIQRRIQQELTELILKEDP